MAKYISPLRASSIKPGLMRNDIHVWRTTLDRPTKVVQRLSSYLSQEERTRASQFHFPRDRARFTVARGALRVILSSYLHTSPERIEFCTTPYGKLELTIGDEVDTGKLEFNLSHSGDIAIYVIARDRRVGVDIERIRPKVEFESLAIRYFSLREQAAFLRYPKSKRQEVFFRIWVLKEAYLKGRGEGLNIPLDNFSVEFNKEQSDGYLEVADDLEGSAHWALRELSLQSGYAAALAVEGHGWDMKMFDLDGLMQAV